MSSAPRGLAPRDGLGSVLVKMGRAGPPFEPRRRPQAGKSGDPRSQNADSSPRSQGAPGLRQAERRKGKCEAWRALTACGLGRCVVVDWTWAHPLTTTPQQLHGFNKSLHAKRVIITCGRGGRRLASSGFKYGSPRALPVHPLLLLHLPHGPAKEALGCREGKSSPGRACLSSAQAWSRPPSQAPRCLHGGSP